MRKWKTNSGDSIEKFAIAANCNCSCACSPCSCRPTPTHDVGESSMSNTSNVRTVSSGTLNDKLNP